MDDNGNVINGSPLVLLAAVDRARRTLNAGRQKPILIDAKFYFVDRQKSAIHALRQALASAGYLNQIGKEIELINDRFEVAYEKIKADIAARTRNNVGRSIFVLDQKGYVDAPIPIVRDILSTFSGAEIILTFAVGWLIDYLSEKPQSLKAVSSLNIRPEQIREYIRLRRERGGRIVIQRLLLEHIHQETGAAYRSPFFIRSADANKDLWIVHLSRHVTARNVMVDSHWHMKNHSWHPGTGGLEILGFNPDLDPDNAPDFWFGERENAVMRERLREDITRRLYDQYGDSPVNYWGLVEQVANETPARLIDLSEVTRSLVDQKIVRLLDKDGLERRALSPRRDDMIRLSHQGNFAF